jgi:hypothetical protein
MFYLPKIVGLAYALKNRWLDDAAGDEFTPIRLKSSNQTFFGTHFVPQKTCLTSGELLACITR